jgi:hypothetical protein
MDNCAGHVKWEILEVRDVDDKVGNGFTVVMRKNKQSWPEKYSYGGRQGE